MSTSPRDELHQLVNLLSDYECDHLYSIVNKVASGERFWEHDIGALYNEYVKARYFDVSRDLSSIVPAGPVYEDNPFVPIPLVKPYPDAARLSLPAPDESELSVTAAIAPGLSTPSVQRPMQRSIPLLMTLA